MKRGAIRNPKTRALAHELGVELLTAVGVLESLWHFGQEFARQGNVGRFTNAHIARGIYWERDPDQLLTHEQLT